MKAEWKRNHGHGHHDEVDPSFDLFNAIDEAVMHVDLFGETDEELQDIEMM